MSGVAAFKKMLSAAAMAGLLAGLLLTGVQKFQVNPIIVEAETYEQAASAATASHAGSAHSSDGHAHDGHSHEHGAWQPEEGLERAFFTALANVSLAVGFALLLGGAMHLRGGVSGWRSGLLWGMAGYAIFFVAPSIGLPPQIPGSEAAALSDRQMWWLITSVFTMVALSLLVFAQRPSIKLAGALLLVVPHLIGAPQPPIHSSPAPVELANSFIYATAIANGMLWLSLGGLMGFFYKRKE